MLDLKPYEADMRHLIDTYIEADEPRKVSPFDDIGLLELIEKIGINEAIGEQLAGLKGSNEAIAETIENNVRSKIIKENLTDPAYFARMSSLLDEIIRLRRTKAVEYADYLQRIAQLVARVQSGMAEDTPPALTSEGQRALYNNLQAETASVANAAQQVPGALVYRALQIDEAIKCVRPDAWRGNVAKEQVIKSALHKILQDEAEVERIFKIILAQKEY